MTDSIQSAPGKEERMRRRTSSWEIWATVFILGLFSWLATCRIMSYATGQDPRIFLHYAEMIRASGYSAASIAHCANWVVPGYPLLLAAALDTVGIFTTYWINLPLFCLCLCLLAIMLRRFSCSREVALTLLASFWIILTGNTLNPHYLFLPFRGVIEWMFMFAVLAVSVPALDRTRPVSFRYRCAFGAGLLMVVGAIFRETVIFLCVPLCLLWLWNGVHRDRTAWKGLAFMLAPVGVVFAGYAIWRLSLGSLLNNQSRCWVIGFLRGGYANPFPILLGDILSLIRTELGVAGLFFLAVGVVLAFRRREKTFFILLSAVVLLILFYSMYKCHVRYTLSVVGLLAIVSGWGFAVTITAALNWLKPRWSGAAKAGVMAALAALSLSAISRMEPWGPRISRADIKSLLESPLASEPFVFVEKDNRHLVDALLAYTRVSPKDPASEGTNIIHFQNAFYIRPLDDKGRTPIKQGIKGEDWLKHFFDIESTGREIVLGGSRSGICRIKAWSNTHLSFGLSAGPCEKGGVLWLDFKSGNGADRIQVDLGNAAKTLSSKVELIRPAGLVPLWVSSDLLRESNLNVSVHSSLPFPGNLDPVFVPAGVFQWFALEQGRLPSAVDLLEEGFEKRLRKDKHGASWLTHATLRIPSLSGSSSVSNVAVSLTLIPRPVSASEIQGTLVKKNDPSSVIDWRIPARRARNTLTWSGHIEPPREPLRLELSVLHRPPDVWYLRVESIGIAFSEAP